MAAESSRIYELHVYNKLKELGGGGTKPFFFMEISSFPSFSIIIILTMHQLLQMLLRTQFNAFQFAHGAPISISLPPSSPPSSFSRSFPFSFSSTIYLILALFASAGNGPRASRMVDKGALPLSPKNITDPRPLRGFPTGCHDSISGS